MNMLNKLGAAVIAALMLLSSGSYLAKSDAAVTKQVGANVDATNYPVTITPCTAYGFSEETTLTLPTGFNTPRMVRVDHDGSSNWGYVIADDASGGIRMAAFDLTTMTVSATYVFQTSTPGKYTQVGRYAGDVIAGRLYTAMLARNGGGSCSGGLGFDCPAINIFNGPIFDSESIDTGHQLATIDDMRASGSSTLLMIVSEGAGTRLFRTYGTSGTFTASGTDTGVSAFGKIANFSLGGFQYAGLVNAGASVYQLGTGSPTVNATFAFSSFGGDLLGAIYTLDQTTDYVAGESDITGGAQAERNWVPTGSLASVTNNTYAAGGTQGAAAFQGTFYDSTNGKVFSYRELPGAVMGFVRTSGGPSPAFTVEQTFTCVSCNQSGGTATGTQVVDYAPQKARMFVGNTGAPGTISRVKVCSSGGPAA